MNGGPATAEARQAEQQAGAQYLLQMARQSNRLIEKPSTPSYRKGYAPADPLSAVPVGGAGLFSPIEVEELNRIEIHLPPAPAGSRWTGSVRVDGKLLPLPQGSIFDEQEGVLYWQLGPGFLGEYQLVFIDGSDPQSASETVIPVRVSARERAVLTP
jgi:hypothetical protein